MTLSYILLNLNDSIITVVMVPNGAGKSTLLKVALSHRLLNKPKMVFMDEPSIGLSPKLINDIFHKIKEIKNSLGTAFVIVEHNLKTLLPLTDWAYILDQGKVIYDGKSEGKTLEKMVSAVF